MAKFKKLANESLNTLEWNYVISFLNYGKFKGYEVILVFDGKYTKSIASIEEITKGFIEVYTDDGETADSFIERGYSCGKASIPMYMLSPLTELNKIKY